MSNPTIEYAESAHDQTVRGLSSGTFFYLKKDRTRILYRKIRIDGNFHILLVSEGRRSEGVHKGDSDIVRVVNVSMMVTK